MRNMLEGCVKKYGDAHSSSNKKTRMIVLFSALALVLIAGAVVLVLYLNHFFYKRVNFAVDHKEMSEDMSEALTDTAIDKDALLSRTVTLLQGKTGVAPYIVDWYMIPGSLSSETALASTNLVAEDQILLLRAYIEGDRKSDAKTLLQAIDDDFVSEDGYIVQSILASQVADTLVGTDSVNDLETVTSEDSLEDTIAYLGALLLYYDKWGVPSDLTRIEKYADLLYSDSGSFMQNQEVILLTPTPYAIGEGQEMLEAADEEKESVGSLWVLPLSSLDLDVFRMLAAYDSKYQVMYDHALSILQGGVISSDIPLYASSYQQDEENYVYTSGDEFQFDLVSSLMVMQYLASEDALPAESVAWVRERLYNEGILYQTYDVISGLAISEEEATEAYGLLLQIAIETDDLTLYTKTLAAVERNLATSSKSAAFSSVYRRTDANRVIVYAKDNLEVYLGVTD